jgi:hypothetical protein
MGGLDEWLPSAYLGLRLGSGYRNRLTDRAGLDYNGLLQSPRTASSPVAALLCFEGRQTYSRTIIRLTTVNRHPGGQNLYSERNLLGPI